MKCIRMNNRTKIERVEDTIARQLVRDGQAVYVPKSEWKKERDKEKT